MTIHVDAAVAATAATLLKECERKRKRKKERRFFARTKDHEKKINMSTSAVLYKLAGEAFFRQ
jgi:hypothetical protein